MRHCRLAICCLLVWLASGCTVRNCTTVQASGDFAATPPGTCAVLRVETRPEGGMRTGKTTWGVAPTQNADARFAEFLAHAAAEEGGMDVVHPYDVAERLERAGLEPTLQPTPEQLRSFARELECASYLAANVKRWKYSYVFIASSAVVEYEVECRLTGTGQLIWSAEVLKQARHTSDRELALAALRDMFRELKSAPSGAPDQPCEEEPGS